MKVSLKPAISSKGQIFKTGLEMFPSLSRQAQFKLKIAHQHQADANKLSQYIWKMHKSIQLNHFDYCKEHFLLHREQLDKRLLDPDFVAAEYSKAFVKLVDALVGCNDHDLIFPLYQHAVDSGAFNTQNIPVAQVQLQYRRLLEYCISTKRYEEFDIYWESLKACMPVPTGTTSYSELMKSNEDNRRKLA